MMVNWIKNDIAVYLQNISAAISENNTEKANNALQDKDRVYDDFSLITQNIVALKFDIRCRFNRHQVMDPGRLC